MTFEESTITWLYIPEMSYGSVRRKFIMEKFRTSLNAAYCVNRKHRPQMKDDPDLRRLVKQGKLKIKRGGAKTSRYSYLILA